MSTEIPSYNLILKDFQLEQSDQINVTSNSKFDAIFNQFIENDLYVYKSFEKIPQFWFCKWYVDDKISGYNRGDFFWINTVDVENFLDNNAAEIKYYADINPYISKKLPTWDKNNPSVVETYLNVLTGYMDQTLSEPLQPLWDVGTLSGSSQLFVSQIDNNKFSLTNETYWKKFLITSDEDYDNIRKIITSKVSAVLDDHVLNYHFNDRVPTLQEIENLKNNYLYSDFSNISAAFPKNFISNKMQFDGFDIVDIYVKKPYPNRTLSGNVVENVWFRSWKSGYLEHGGIINIEHYKTTDNKIVIPFNWELASSETPLYDTRFLKSNNDKLIKFDTETSLSGVDTDVISVIVELHKEMFKVEDKTFAPIFKDTNYKIQLTPLIKILDDNGTVDEQSNFLKVGMNTAGNNSINNDIDLTNLSTFGFSFDFNKLTTSNYYAYYVGGYH